MGRRKPDPEIADCLKCFCACVLKTRRADTASEQPPGLTCKYLLYIYIYVYIYLYS